MARRHCRMDGVMCRKVAIRHSGSLRLRWHCRNVRHSYHRILQNAVVTSVVIVTGKAMYKKVRSGRCFAAHLLFFSCAGFGRVLPISNVANFNFQFLTRNPKLGSGWCAGIDCEHGCWVHKITPKYRTVCIFI